MFDVEIVAKVMLAHIRDGEGETGSKAATQGNSIQSEREGTEGQ